MSTSTSAAGDHAAALVHDKERAAGLAAVRSACALAEQAQSRLAELGSLTKGDQSPVTVADFAVQAVVSAELRDTLDEFDLVAEESADELVDGSRASLLGAVTDLALAVRKDSNPMSVLEWIGAGAADGTSERFWTLDPIDGTRGFMRGDQYAIALALVDRGRVVLGVLGCPNLVNPDGSRGAIFLADAAGCVAYQGERDVAVPVPVHVAQPASLEQARVCESVEAGHSDQGLSAQIASALGIETAPFRIDSQCKYAAVARGDASIYLRLPTRADYRERIWDHAAGKLIVESAGGRVTDITGAPLDFGHGRRLEVNRGVIATDGRFHDRVVEAVRAAVPVPRAVESSRSR